MVAEILKSSEREACLHACDALGNTPLHLASFNGHLGVVRLLLKYGADPNRQNGELDTPIYMAVLANSIECVVALAEKRVHFNWYVQIFPAPPKKALIRARAAKTWKGFPHYTTQREKASSRSLATSSKSAARIRRCRTTLASPRASAPSSRRGCRSSVNERADPPPKSPPLSSMNEEPASHDPLREYLAVLGACYNWHCVVDAFFTSPTLRKGLLAVVA